MKKLEIIDISQETPCYTCNGTGLGNLKEIECNICNGTGKYKQDNYILIATQPNGDKIAFNADQEGK